MSHLGLGALSNPGGQEFLAGVAAKKGRWRELTAKVDCVTPLYYWMGHGRDPLEVAFAQSTRPLSQAELKDLWRSRHGNAAVPLLLVVAYPRDGGARAHVCGPTGETTLVADVELSQAERLAMAGLAEPDRHLAIRTLETSLTQTVDEVPGLRNRGLLATHELLKGVPRRADWARATQTSCGVLRARDHELLRHLGYTLELAGQHHVLRTAGGNARAVAVFLQQEEQARQVTGPRSLVHYW